MKATEKRLGGDAEIGRRPSRAITSGPRLGQAIRQARKELGWTQAELYKKSGVARPQISAIESARADPKASTLIALLRSLDCEMEVHPVDHTRFRLEDHLKTIMGDG
ncbi:MAG: helix-turn-helix transcriptional regulator [bacterium]|nr:helix-turn-helix transcriptional regulator [bacterium]